MGSVKSRPRSLPFEGEVEDHSETTKTCCWTGIRKLFSKSKRAESMAMHVMEDEMDSDDDNDNVILVNASSKSSATSIQSVTAVEPTGTVGEDLQKSWSAPAVLGQDRHQAMMPAALSKVEDELPSTSYPKDVRVSSQCFLFYHRYINDEEKDDESVTSDIECRDEVGDDADVESNADDPTPVPGLVYSEDEYTDDDCSVDQEDQEEIEIKDAIEESSEDDTSSQTDQIEMVKRFDLLHMTKAKVMYQTDEDDSSYPSSGLSDEDNNSYLSSGLSGNDVTSDEDATLLDDGVCVDDITIMFLISLIWTCIRENLYGIYEAGLHFVHDIVMGEEDEMDIDEERAVAVRGKTGDRTPQDEDNSSFLSSGLSGNDVTGDEEATLLDDGVCVDDITAMFLISLIWTFIRKHFYGIYEAGLQFVDDILMGEEDEIDIDEERAMVVRGKTGDRIAQDEDNSSFLSSGLSCNDVTGDEEATLLDDGVCVDEIKAIFVISLIWTFIHKNLYGIYEAGLQFVDDIMMGEEDEMDIDEERPVVVRGKTGDRTPQGHQEIYPDSTFGIWAYIRNACDSVFQTGLQFIEDIVIGEDDDEMDIDEESVVVVHGETEDHTPKDPPERHPDFTFKVWAYIRNVCDSVYQYGLQFVHEIVIGEDEDEMDVD